MEFDKKEFKKRIVLKIETRKRNIGNDSFFDSSTFQKL